MQIYNLKIISTMSIINIFFILYVRNIQIGYFNQYNSYFNWIYLVDINSCLVNFYINILNFKFLFFFLSLSLFNDFQLFLNMDVLLFRQLLNLKFLLVEIIYFYIFWKRKYVEGSLRLCGLFRIYIYYQMDINMIEDYLEFKIVFYL